VAQPGLGHFGFVQEIEARIEAVVHELQIRVEAGLELVIVHALAAGLVDEPRVTIERERHRERIARGAFQREIAEFGKAAAEARGVAVVETGHAADVVGRAERAKLDLDELGGREFVLIFGLGRRVMTVALAEPADAVDREFLFAFDADAGAGGEAEDIFGLDVEPIIGIFGARDAAETEQGDESAAHHASMPCKSNYSAHADDPPLAPVTTASANVLHSGSQKDSF